jgi:hypothetical protein
MATITISGTLYEVYGNLSSANSYFTAAIHGAPWTAASTADRKKALVTATRVFERTGWQGAPTDPVDKTQPQPASTQPLEWPRTDLVDLNDVVVPSDSIPQDVVDGNFEYALAIINDAAIQTAAQTGSNVKVDNLTERVEGAITVTTEKTLFNSTLGKNGQFPTIVQDYIGLWLASTKAAVGIVAGGTDVCAQSGADYGFNTPGFP